jgi:hypothetical protein
MAKFAASAPKTVVHAAMPKTPEEMLAAANTPGTAWEDMVGTYLKSRKAVIQRPKSLSEDTIRSIKKFQADIANSRQTIAKIKNGKYYEENSWAKRDGQENVIKTYEENITNRLNQIKLGRAKDIPPGYLPALELYGQKPLFAQSTDLGIIHSALTRKTLGKSQTLYRALSEKDMADIVGFKMMPSHNMVNGKAWMKEHGYPEQIPTKWSAGTFGHGWLDNAVDLIKKAGVESPKHNDFKSASPFMWFAKGIKKGESWIPNKSKSFTNSLEWAKKIAHEGGTSGGEMDAVAKVNFGPNVKGINDLMDLGIGGNRASLADSEAFIAPFTQYILKEINLLKHRIPGEGGFAGEGAHQRWEGGRNYSKLLDEYVFEAIQTLPTPHIPHYAMGGMVGPKYNIPKSSTSVTDMPFNRYNGGGMVNNYGGITVNPSAGMDEKMLAKYVISEMKRADAISFASQGRPGSRSL